jgi:hypothetical protein
VCLHARRHTSHGCLNSCHHLTPCTVSYCVYARAKEGQCKELTANDMLLLDSGALYLDGTTGRSFAHVRLAMLSGQFEQCRLVLPIRHTFATYG